jgi:S-adenosylmethionine hydrolase
MFSPCGLITITTDFGHQGPFVATMKGRILTHLPTARIIDVTHEVPVYWPAEAGFWLSRSFAYFPSGTVHIGVVDPGVGTKRDIIGVEADGHVFLAPDNGLLAPVIGRAASSSIYRVDVEAMRRALGLAVPSATFHGRDLFAPIAAALAAGQVAPNGLGPQIHDVVPAWVDEPTVASDHVTGVVITIDHFGNLITNIDASLIQPFADPIVKTAGHSFPLRRTYGDVSPGQYLALVNSFGVIELARAEQSAAEGLGLGRGAPVVVTRS